MKVIHTTHQNEMYNRYYGFSSVSLDASGDSESDLLTKLEEQATEYFGDTMVDCELVTEALRAVRHGYDTAYGVSNQRVYRVPRGFQFGDRNIADLTFEHRIEQVEEHTGGKIVGRITNLFARK